MYNASRTQLPAQSNFQGHDPRSLGATEDISTWPHKLSKESTTTPHAGTWSNRVLDDPLVVHHPFL